MKTPIRVTAVVAALHVIVSSAAAGTFTISTTDTSGPGSLAQAIEDANAAGGPDEIVFNITGTGIHTIALTAPLPPITDPVVIDGTTQPGYAGMPVIQISGANAGVGVDGLTISAGDSTLRGLAINRFNHDGIVLLTNGNNVVESCHVGTNAAGTAEAHNNRDGIFIGSANNHIGGTSAALRNVISGNGQNGIEISGGGATGNVVEGNFIGTNRAGNTDLSNSSGVLLDAPGNTIGGTVPGSRNVILGSSNPAIYMPAGNAGGNTIQGNYIGVNAAGNAGLGPAGVDIFTPNNSFLNMWSRAIAASRFTRRKPPET